MISIAGNSLQSQETRKLSLVLLYMLVDTAPTVIRHAQTSYFLQPVLNVIFPMLLEIEEDPDWETQDDEPHDENSLFFVGRTGSYCEADPWQALPPLLL